MNQNTHYVVDVEFNDVTLHRPIHFKDHFGFSMAVLNEDGVLFASPLAKGETVEENRQAVLHYRAFASWASPSDWTIYMPKGEDIVAIALGSKWAACFTSENLVRIFTMSGIQSYMYCHTGGPVVAVVGEEEFMFVVKYANPHPGKTHRLLDKSSS